MTHQKQHSNRAKCCRAWWILAFAPLVLSLVFSRPATAAPIVDHSYEFCTGNGNFFAFLGAKGQAFDVKTTGFMTGFDLFLSRGLSEIESNGIIAWELRRTYFGLPWLTPQGVLVSNSVLLSILPARPGAYVHFEITNAPMVNAGEELAMIVRGTHIAGAWVGDNPSCGSGGFGYAFSLDTGSTYIFAGAEFGFRTYVEPFPPFSQPILGCPEARTLECDDAFATFTCSVVDPSGLSVEVVWFLDGFPIQTNLVAEGHTGTNLISFSGDFSMGEHVIGISASNKKTEPVTCTIPFVVKDTRPPIVQGVFAEPSILWPPNHQMVAVGLSFDAFDTCGLTSCRVVGVEIFDPFLGSTRPADPGDWSLNQGFLQLRAIRSSQADARIYHVVVECSDPSGNSVRAFATVTVPHDQRNNVENVTTHFQRR